MVRLHVDPNTPPLTWEDFCLQKGPYAVALDGYVAGGPRFDAQGPCVNFNHHEGVDRLATRATCGQVHMAILQGLFRCFQQGGHPHLDIWVNDPDQDVCTSVFLLANAHLSEVVMAPMLNRLVAMEDALDATAGAYPFPKALPTLRQLAWVFEPYTRFRILGGVDRRIASEFEGVITDVGARIMMHITGSGNECSLDLNYKIVGREPGWSLVTDEGQQGRTGMFSDGITAFVSFRPRPSGDAYTYTVARISPFIPFPVPDILRALSEREGCGGDCWGGGDTIGGSPRVSGSRLQPQEVVEIVNDTLQR